MRTFLRLLMLTCTGYFVLPAQVQDNFSDGDLSANPAWAGDVARFQVNAAFELQSNGLAATDTLYLSTPCTSVAGTEWRIDVRYAFAPSTSNLIRYYLVSNAADLSGPLNGYYVQAGETGSLDSYDLYRQDGSTHTRLIDGLDGRATNAITATLKVLRDGAGNWQLFTDTGSGAFVAEGTATDATYTSSAHLGVWLKHSSTRNTAFFFDNVYAGPPVVDNQPPQLLGATALSATQVELLFDEAISESSAALGPNYNLNNGIGQPLSAQRDPADPKKAKLTLASALQNNITYIVSVNGLSDLAGNPITTPQTASLSFFTPDVPQPGDVIINELMADPTPVLGLPDAEYLELHNTSSKSFELSGWKLSNGTTVSTLPSFVLATGAYVVLCPAASASLLSPFGPVLGLTSWPALVNGGDNIGLRSQASVLLDSVDYQLSWYKDAAKDDGGYALERINPSPDACPGSSNWAASVSPTGGTPGTANSVFSTSPDVEPPQVMEVSVISSDSLLVCFDGTMDVSTLTTSGNYFIDNQIGFPAQALSQGTDNSCVLLKLADPLQEGLIYQLIVQGVKDCGGNPLAAPDTTQIALGSQALAYDLVITEIFPDPSPARSLPETEFIEIYNRSTKVIDLADVVITDGSGVGRLGQRVILPGEYLILTSEAGAADFQSFGNVAGLSSFPSLNNTGDPLFLIGPAGDTLDFVIYSDDWYGDVDKADGGWTIERIDPDFTGCNNPANWLASNDVSGGTPGRKNSVDAAFTDSDAPVVKGISVLDASTVLITFSEPMDAGLLGDPAFYSIDNGIGGALSAAALAPDYQQVVLTFLPLDTNVFYTLTFTDIADCFGNTLDAELSLGLPLPAQPGDVLLNEILFNPYVGGFDFVEVVNVSDNILDFNSLFLGEIDPETGDITNPERISPSGRLFLPGQIVCLTRDEAYHRQIYLPPGNASFLQMSDMPGFDDDKGEVVVFVRDTVVLDRFAYLDDYHFPLLDDDEGVSLERISLNRPTQDPANWHSAASTVNYATPGYENSQATEVGEPDGEVSLQSVTFSPNGDGRDDILAINYQFGFPGANARVSIFDSQGRLIKIISQNTLLGLAPGTFFWDGTDSKNTKADVGIYVVLVEVSNQETGEKKSYRRSAVLADVF